MTKRNRPQRKRENGDGTLYQRKSGTWVVGVTIPVPPGMEPQKPTRVWDSAASREAARLKLPDLVEKANAEARRREAAADQAAKIAEGPATAPMTVTEAATLFLSEIKADRKKSEGTHDWYMRFLDQLCAFGLDQAGTLLGSIPFADFRKDHVRRWIASKPDWADNTARAAGRAATALCNWAVKSDSERVDAIKASPLGGFELSSGEPRECDLSKEEWKKLLSAKRVDNDLRDILVFMRSTGCRPEEMREAEKRHFDPSIPAIVFPPSEWKNGRRGKIPKERVIHLPGEALTIIQKQCLRRPTGKLFRNGRGTPITKDGLCQRFSRISADLKIPHLIPYSLRHTYATDMAFRNDAIVLAELMGTSVRMLEHIYAKVRKRKDLMAQAAAKALEGFA